MTNGSVHLLKLPKKFITYLDHQLLILKTRFQTTKKMNTFKLKLNFSLLASLLPQFRRSNLVDNLVRFILQCIMI